MSLRLLHVNLGVSVSVQKCVLHLQLDDSVFPDSSHNQEHPCSGVITHRGKYMKEIFPLSLSKTFGHESCFKLVKATVLTLKTHFSQTGFLPGGSSVSSHVPRSRSVCISVSIAFFHLSVFGPATASSAVRGYGGSAPKNSALKFPM